MRLRKCEFCGAEIEDSMIMFEKGSVNPDSLGWAVLELYTPEHHKIKRDMCPKCIPAIKMGG